MDETRTEQKTSNQEPTPPPPPAAEELETLRQERDKYLDLLQRTQADFDNYQKRNRRELELERKYALTPLARDLLPVLDNLDRALASSPAENSLTQGVRMVRKQLLDILRRHHIEEMNCQGKPFDPNHHEAMMEEPSAEHPPGTILRVLEPGFVYHDRVLRPAKVVLAKAPPPALAATEGRPEGEEASLQK
ncbi:MAG: nucleotide exchange factor GrpE [Gemmatales bacterium]|nr:nucleotide exchange factor GrpE [Gemmatales bacterium]MDW8387029.1 nucleotide exchange factor GrpE [Gemmatales bacterium]